MLFSPSARSSLGARKWQAFGAELSQGAHQVQLASGQISLRAGEMSGGAQVKMATGALGRRARAEEDARSRARLAAESGQEQRRIDRLASSRANCRRPSQWQFELKRSSLNGSPNGPLATPTTRAAACSGLARPLVPQSECKCLSFWRPKKLKSISLVCSFDLTLVNFPHCYSSPLLKISTLERLVDLQDTRATTMMNIKALISSIFWRSKSTLWRDTSGTYLVELSVR